MELKYKNTSYICVCVCIHTHTHTVYFAGKYITNLICSTVIDQPPY